MARARTLYFSRTRGVVAVRRALAWLASVPGPAHGAIVVPTKENFVGTELETALPDLARALARDRAYTFNDRTIVGATPRTFRAKRLHGPVLALWPSAESAARLLDEPYTTHVCVVPGVEGELDAWVRATEAEDLDGVAPTLSATVADPVVERALEAITRNVNLSSGIANSTDEARAVQAFRILKKGRHRWTTDEVYTWALGNGWSSKQAAALSEVAEGVENGRKMRVDPSPYWAENILAKWRNG